MTMKVIGIEEVDKILSDIAPRHANNLMKATIHGVAGEIRDNAKKEAPKDEGTLKRAIKAKRRRGLPGKPLSEVRVEHGNDARHDAFYWRFLEYGTVNHEAVPFISPAIEAVRADMVNIIRAQFGKKLEKALARERKKQQKAAKS